MAAKNEESRQMELRKRKQYLNAPKASASTTSTAKNSEAKAGTTLPKPHRVDRNSKFCVFCHKPGHLRRECRRRIKSESTSTGAANHRNSPSLSTKQVKADNSLDEDQDTIPEDPLDSLFSTDSDEEQEVCLV